MAAIAATSPHVAEEAAKLIQVEYEVLPAVLTIADALKDDAPLGPRQPDYGYARPGWSGDLGYEVQRGKPHPAPAR